MNKSKLMLMAAAAVAAFTGAPTARLPVFTPAAGMFAPWGGGRRRRGRGWNGKNETARAAGVPKAFRQYARRYGSSVQRLQQMHLQLGGVPMLDHGRDRREAMQRALGVQNV